MGRGRTGRPAHPAGALVALTLAAACGRDVPILMYHSVGNGQDALSVTPAQLEDQLDYLQTAGFQTVSLAQVIDREDGRGRLPAHAIVLTFDDGYDDAYSVVLPALKRRGMTATFFIPTGFIAANVATRKTDPASKRSYLIWDEVLSLRAAGMEIGSHTVRHGELSKLRKHELAFEVEESKRVLEEHLGEPVQFFAYPFTRQRLRVRKAVMQAGYRAGVVGPRGGLDRFELQRLVIHRWTTAKDLRDLLAEPWAAQ